MNKKLKTHIDEEGLVLREEMSGHEVLFKKYFKPLAVYATRLLGDIEEAQDIVQDVFINVWNNKRDLTDEKDMTAYLFVAVKNGCLKKLRHQQVKHRYENYMKSETSPLDNPHHYMMLQEIEQCIEETLLSMPQRTQDIFVLSRYENKKYKEIAAALNISIKTVELHVGKALAALRGKLKNYLTILLILLITI